HHHADDGQVQEPEAQREHHPAQCLAALHHLRPSIALTWLCWNSARGTSSSSTITQVTAAAIGQSVLPKNSVHITRPIMRVLAPPSSSGITYSPTVGMNTSMAPAITPLRDSGRVIVRKARQ